MRSKVSFATEISKDEPDVSGLDLRSDNDAKSADSMAQPHHRECSRLNGHDIIAIQRSLRMSRDSSSIDLAGFSSSPHHM